MHKYDGIAPKEHVKRNMKIFTGGNEKLSEAVQEELFALGYRWAYGRGASECTEAASLRPRESGKLKYGSTYRSYIERSSEPEEEVNLSQLVVERIAHEKFLALPKVREMTVVEIQEALGHEVKIIEG